MCQFITLSRWKCLSSKYLVNCLARTDFHPFDEVIGEVRSGSGFRSEVAPAAIRLMGEKELP
jgi:hypothetical protein